MAEAAAQTAETTEGSNGEAAKGKIKFESSMQREEAIAYFEAIVAGLKQGTLHFKQGEESLTVSPATNLDVSVKASKKGSEEKVTFEIAWTHRETGDFEITTG